jgi:hypothetical protein
MKVVFTALTPSLIPASQAFNERLRGHGEPPFTLPEETSAQGKRLAEGIERTHYVAVDEGGAVRGGVLLMEQRGWLRQQSIPLINIQSPLTEGTIDRTFAGVGLQLLKFVSSRSPYLYAVGMGSQQNPFARLLSAAGWTVNPVPFQFEVVRASRFLREIGPLRTGSRGWLARAVAAVGLGSAALAGWQLAHRGPSLRGYSLQPGSGWPEGLDAVWSECRDGVSFSVLRDEPTLAALYPDSQSRLKRFVLRSGGEIAGWSVGLVTRMKNDPNFGDLLVGTILDGLAAKAHLGALLAMTRDALLDLGAELIVTNQMHCSWQSEMRRLGFLSGPSNYMLAISKAISTALRDKAEGSARMHVNRGDGDGRIHL